MSHYTDVEYQKDSWRLYIGDTEQLYSDSVPFCWYTNVNDALLSAELVVYHQLGNLMLETRIFSLEF